MKEQGGVEVVLQTAFSVAACRRYLESLLTNRARIEAMRSGAAAARPSAAAAERLASLVEAAARKT